MKPFKNRDEAAVTLAENLAHSFAEKKVENACILALPRGGVPIAWRIAQKTGLPWDILLVKKIGAPGHPEFAVGAVSEDEHPIWNYESIHQLGIRKAQLRQSFGESRRKIIEQSKKWRLGRTSLNVKGKTVILVDDGLATGLTMQAAVQFLRRREASKIIVAVPVASRSAVEMLQQIADDVITLAVPEPFFSVGQWYDDFTQVTDEMVSDLLVNSAQDIEQGLSVKIPVDDFELDGDLTVPLRCKGVVIFAHGSGSSRKSPRNRFVAKALNDHGFATLLFDLLSIDESENRKNVFNIQLLSHRLLIATRWLQKYETLKNLPMGYFGASTGAAAALVAASIENLTDKKILSVVSRGGRPDLAGGSLTQVTSRVLLIVGGYDTPVIELNEAAIAKLKHAQMVIVPKAGHLFEEEGTLEQVVEYAKDWFNKTLVSTRSHQSIQSHEDLVQEIKSRAQVVQNDEDWGALLQNIARSRVVMLGEASHGTEEFYELRKIISQQLIRDYGFKFIAVEGDWPDCYRLNRYIQWSEGSSARQIMSQFKRWPTWMWANEQVNDLIEWMTARNAGFYGLDVYSLYESLDLIKTHVKKLDASTAQSFLEAYACFESFNRDEIAYAKSLTTLPKGCQQEVLRNLREILRMRLEETSLHEDELFDIQQNAKIIRNAEEYYRAMLQGGADSWNIRDKHMMETLDTLLHHYGEGAKGIVWAHNTHIGDYHATDMVDESYINLGGLAREIYGADAVSLVGFGTYQGRVLAGRAWGAPVEEIVVAPAAKGSYEDYFHQASEKLNSNQFYLTMNREKSLSERRGHRAIGVVYQTIFEAHGRNYVPTDLSHRYDAFVFVDKTTALRPIAGHPSKGVFPETWPMGT